ncbi:MAG: ABC transporter ATP-binding protein [Haloferacaceae archaeon]
MTDARPSGAPKVTLRDVSKEYETTGRTVTALRSIDAAFREGELVSVLGPSGGGKTTLLRLIAGLESPTGGEIRVDGRRVAGPGPERGIVFQEPTLFPWRSVAENVRFGLEETDVGPEATARRVESLLTTVGLDDRADAAPGELSGGMKKRVEIARALAPDPELLLLDEPFGNLDARTRAELQRDLLETWERTGKTIVFVTHATGEAIKLSDRVLVLGSDGTIAERIDVDLPRPRRPTGSAFRAYKNRLVRAIRGRGAPESPREPAPGRSRTAPEYRSRDASPGEDPDGDARNTRIKNTRTRNTRI